ncbi:hypothetical protein [Veronia pacifica]|uniref:Uncharacterized protein n=1 Tax=Veronia pacifica TaxID=1080227 RepID=A0A1C3EPE4_9GAMM|nr:hypothetical protein [Veronia pacifica]ODA35108.1 hypothetical protein A8L45_05370 [Veronia pacifica]
MKKKLILASAIATALVSQLSIADTISSPKKQNAQLPTFDILTARVTSKGNIATFEMEVVGKAGSKVAKRRPGAGAAGAEAHAYVWPTSIDSYHAGFDKKQGILAIVAATHPDFDDTPLFDESGDNNYDNDGGVWHTHWVVLSPEERCGPGALAVKDIPEGATPRLPVTWPGLPILLDSPGYDPIVDGQSVTIRVPFPDKTIVQNASFDGVTAALRVNANVHAPLFCVTNVFDVASGDLSLPGKITEL